ncbi:hypothetical protein Lsan_2048 [Legionella santicrucis]|uniref:Uncharacterized protein n=1 Tax=Legionella santicrucis TaxID=45074 RepID=A0A0W0YUC2_9GAMM|nr:hypothetical protein Lsan_2048 [Legionella santicrucis]
MKSSISLVSFELKSTALTEETHDVPWLVPGEIHTKLNYLLGAALYAQYLVMGIDSKSMVVK